MPPKTAAPKKTADHVSYQAMIIDAIINLKDRQGSSRVALKKYVKANNTLNVSDRAFDTLLNKAIRTGVEKGIFEQPKGSSGGTKLAKKDAKLIAPKKEKKVATEKKPVAKKATTSKTPAAKKAPTAKKPVVKKAAASKKEKAVKPKAAPKAKATPKKKAAAPKAAPAIVDKPAVLGKTKSGRVTKTTPNTPAAKKAKATPKKASAKKATPKKVTPKKATPKKATPKKA